MRTSGRSVRLASTPSENRIVGLTTMIRNLEKARLLQGAWGHQENWGQFTVKVGRTGIRVTGCDVDDGEVFAISNIQWDGEVLSFDALTPSTGWLISHQFEPKRGGTIQEVTTFRQVLKKQKPTKPRSVRR